MARAAFNASGVSRNNRLIERHESTNGAYWRSYDFGGNADRKNVFAHPLGPGDGQDGFEHDGGETIFALPNGLQGYMLIDARGARIDKGPMEIVRDNKQADGAVVNGISCMSCHNRGLIEKADQLREVVEKTKAFDKKVPETVMVLYPPRETMDEYFRGRHGAVRAGGQGDRRRAERHRAGLRAGDAVRGGDERLAGRGRVGAGGQGLPGAARPDRRSSARRWACSSWAGP